MAAYPVLSHLPRGYTERDDWPLLIFLHGAGERGTDLSLLKKWGPPALIDTWPDFPFVLLAPQCPLESWWTAETARLDAFLDEALVQHRVDPGRVYLTGFSMGGYGVWQWALASPYRFAALVTVAGGGFSTPQMPIRINAGPQDMAKIAHIPSWSFAGALDEFVPPAEVQATVDALRVGGGDPRLTIYPDADHEVTATRAFADPVLYDWLLAQRRVR